jgi:hypothetical protein
MSQPACARSSRHTASEARHGGERMSVAIKEDRSALVDGLFPALSGSWFAAAVIEIRPIDADSRRNQQIPNRGNSPLISRAHISGGSGGGSSSGAEKICTPKSARYRGLKQSSGSEGCKRRR